MHKSRLIRHGVYLQEHPTIQLDHVALFYHLLACVLNYLLGRGFPQVIAMPIHLEREDKDVVTDVPYGLLNAPSILRLQLLHARWLPAALLEVDNWQAMMGSEFKLNFDVSGVTYCLRS